jgi:hypothetical protein
MGAACSHFNVYRITNRDRKARRGSHTHAYTNPNANRKLSPITGCHSHSHALVYANPHGFGNSHLNTYSDQHNYFNLNTISYRDGYCNGDPIIVRYFIKVLLYIT